MDGQQLLTMVQVTGFIGFVASPISGLVDRFVSDKRKKDLIIVAALILVAAGAAFLIGNINPTACSGTELGECIGIVVGYINLVLVQALAWHKMYFEDSAIRNKIAGK